MPPERPSKVSSGIFFKFYIARKSVESEDFVVPYDTNVQCYDAHVNSFQNMSLSWPIPLEDGEAYCVSYYGSFLMKVASSYFRIQFNSEEHWTKALKFMLTNLKWGLAWVSSQFTDKK